MSLAIAFVPVKLTTGLFQFYYEFLKKEPESADEQGIDLTLSFELEQPEGETPVQMAVRLVQEELGQLESKNQLENYLKAFEVSIELETIRTNPQLASFKI